MLRFKQKISLVFALFFSVFISLSYSSIQAASRPATPKIKFVTAPRSQYTVGDSLKFSVQSPKYYGRVQYRVVVFNTTTKSSVDIWSSSNGYPARYYTKSQPAGLTTFTMGWVIKEPGDYKITVYTRRVGITGSKLALPKLNCDSYVDSAVFHVKNKQMTISQEGAVLGQQDPKKQQTVMADVTISKKDVTCQNIYIWGDAYIKADNATLNNVYIKGTLYLDPGDSSTVNFSTVFADKVQVLSGGADGYDFKNVRATSLTYNMDKPVTLTVSGNTSFDNTYIYKEAALYGNGGSFGNVFLSNKGTGDFNIILKGSIRTPVVPQTDAVITTEGDVQPIASDIRVLPLNNKDITVTLNGRFGDVKTYNASTVVLEKGTYVSQVTAYNNSFLYVDDGAEVNLMKTNDAYEILFVDGSGKIDNEDGFIEHSIGTDELPEASAIDGNASADTYFGYEYGIYNYNISRYPYFSFRLMMDNKAPLPTKYNGTVYLSTGYNGAKFKYNSESNIYSIGVNKDDGTLILPGGNYEMYIPASDGKWYTLRFTTKQVGKAGDLRSELTSINGKPYTYVRWKAPASIKSTTYVTLGTSLADALKILGKPSSYKISSDGYGAVYFFNKNGSEKYSGIMGNYVYFLKVDGTFIAEGWENDGHMKISMGNANPKAAPFKQFSTKQDVVNAMGTPSTVDVEPNYEKWIYKGSNVVFVDDRVTEWTNNGNLKVSMGNKASNPVPFTIGSTRQDVINAMGTPTGIAFGDAYYLSEGWSYGQSSLHFDENTGLVDSYSNAGNLNVSLGKIDPSAPLFTMGSTKDEVIKSNGTPTKVVSWGDGSGYWVYGQHANNNNSTVNFDRDGRVVEYQSYGDLRVSMGNYDPAAPGFDIGSTGADVAKSNGTPTRVIDFGDGTSQWTYPGGTVNFDKNGTVVQYNITGTLNVAAVQMDPSAPPFFIGSSKTDVGRANGAPYQAGGSTTGTITWDYQGGSVTFDKDGKVIYYNNTGGLKVGAADFDPAAPAFTIGSTFDDVVRSNGAPSRVYAGSAGIASVNYGDSTVSFDTGGQVNGYSNKGNLKVSLGDADPSAPVFFLGSSKDDVIKAQGTPDEIATFGIDSSNWYYDGSYVTFDKYGKVIAINGVAGLKAGFGDKDPSAPPFSFGSPEADVIKANGNPERAYIYSDGTMTFLYSDGSYVFFDSSGNVIRYLNNGGLKITAKAADPSAPGFFLGSTGPDVVNANGTPSNYWGNTDDTITWTYNDSSFVKFSNVGKVIEFNNAGCLKLDMDQKDPSAPSFALGSMITDVVKASGSPVKAVLNSDGSIHFEFDSYQGATPTVDFDSNGKVIGWNNPGSLSISLGSIDPNAPPVSIGSSMNDVISAYGTPSRIDGAIWYYTGHTITFDGNQMVSAVN